MDNGDDLYKDTVKKKKKHSNQIKNYDFVTFTFPYYTFVVEPTTRV